MDLKQLEYIVMIAEENSITKAAERLFITQSGLNQQLLKLEAELGIQLFHRSKNDFRLTEAGHVYVSYARKILQLKHEAYNILNDMANNKTGTLRIGLTPERGIPMFMSIYPAFYARYPHITIEPLEIGVWALSPSQKKTGPYMNTFTFSLRIWFWPYQETIPWPPGRLLRENLFPPSAWNTLKMTGLC